MLKMMLLLLLLNVAEMKNKEAKKRQIDLEKNF